MSRHFKRDEKSYEIVVKIILLLATVATGKYYHTSPNFLHKSSNSLKQIRSVISSRYYSVLPWNDSCFRRTKQSARHSASQLGQDRSPESETWSSGRPEAAQEHRCPRQELLLVQTIQNGQRHHCLPQESEFRLFKDFQGRSFQIQRAALNLNETSGGFRLPDRKPKSWADPLLTLGPFSPNGPVGPTGPLSPLGIERLKETERVC